MAEASDALREAAAELAKAADFSDLGEHMWGTAQWLLYRAAAMDINAQLESINAELRARQRVGGF